MEVDKPIRQYLSLDATPIMREGIGLTFSRWSALQMAIDNEWGGRDSRLKAQQFVDDILAWFTHSKELYIDDLEAQLDEFMLSLNTMIDDGSVEEVAESLMIMHEECLEGHYNSVEVLRERPRAPTVSHVRQVLNDDEDDSEDDVDDKQIVNGASEMAVDATYSSPNSRPAAMAVDDTTVQVEGGWTVVSSSRKKKATK